MDENKNCSCSCACSCGTQEPETAEIEFDESVCSAEFTDGCTKTVKEQQD